MARHDLNYVESAVKLQSTNRHKILVVFLCFHYRTMSAKTLCFRAVSPPRSSFRSFVRPDRYLPRYFMNCLNNLDETDGKYSLASTDDLICVFKVIRNLHKSPIVPLPLHCAILDFYIFNI